MGGKTKRGKPRSSCTIVGGRKREGGEGDGRLIGISRPEGWMSARDTNQPTSQPTTLLLCRPTQARPNNPIPLPSYTKSEKLLCEHFLRYTQVLSLGLLLESANWALDPGSPLHHAHKNVRYDSNLADFFFCEARLLFLRLPDSGDPRSR